MLHEYIAKQLKERADNPYADLESLSIEQRNTVMDCMSWMDDLIEEHCMDDTNKCFFELEVETPLEWRDGDKIICSGTADAVIFPLSNKPNEDPPSPYNAIIVDWKFGRAEIEHANATLQLLGYSILLFEQYAGLKHIQALIYQPRVGAIYAADFNRASLAKYKKEITDTIAACQVKDPVLAPSTAACNYCKGIAVCPAVENMSRELTESVSQGLTADPEEAISALLAHKSPDELGEIYSQSKVVTMYAKAVKDFCKESLRAEDDSVTGWTIQKRKGKKKLTDNQEAAKLLDVPVSAMLRHGTLRLSLLADLLRSPIISREELLRCAEISVSGLEKEFIEQECEANGTTKAKERKHFNETLESVIETGDTIHAIIKKKESK